MHASTSAGTRGFTWRTALACLALIAVSACGGGDAGGSGTPSGTEPVVAAGAQRQHVDAAGGALAFFDNALVVTLPANAVAASTYVDVLPLADAHVDTDTWRSIDGTAFRVTFGGTLLKPAAVAVAVSGGRVAAAAAPRAHALLVQPFDNCVLMYTVGIWDPKTNSFKLSTTATPPVLIVNGAEANTTESVDLTAGAVWMCTGTPTHTAANVALRVLNQPQSQTVSAGAAVTFSIDVDGTAPAAYQWRHGSTDIPGANYHQLTLNNVQVADAGSYQVKVSNIAGSLLSSVATLGVTPINTSMTLSTAPADVSAALGGTAPFSVAVSGGSAPYTYQWQRNGADLVDQPGSVAGATTAQLSLSNLTLAYSGAVIGVVVTDSAGQRLGTQATLTVNTQNAQFLVTAQPQAGSTVVGGRITYSMTVTGTPPLRVQWGYNDNCSGSDVVTWPTLNNVPMGADFATTADQTSAVSPATFTFTTPPLVAADDGMCWGALAIESSTNLSTFSALAPAAVAQPTVSATPQVSLPLALKSDGTVWLLPGTDINFYAPAPAYSGGTGNWRLDYDRDNTVISGRLTVPRQVAVSPAVAVAGSPQGNVPGGSNSYVLRADGAVWQFGSTSTAGSSYMPLPGIDQVSAIARGDYYSLLLRNGVVYAYGGSTSGGLGLGLSESAFVPTVVAGLPSGIRAVSAAGDTSMALDAAGNVWVWGVGASASMVNGLFVAQNTPRRVDGLSGVDQIAAVRGAMAMRSGGAVYLAGSNIASLPGATCPVGTLYGCLLITPTAQPQLASGVAAIAGGSALYAVTTAGVEVAWGARNVFGELGTGAAAAQNNYVVPTPVQGLTGVQGLGSGGFDQAVAWRSDGTVFLWGYDAAHFADPTALSTTSLTQPTAIPGFVLH
jgi:hypothetical protein